jgi:hypothetical protein
VAVSICSAYQCPWQMSGPATGGVVGCRRSLRRLGRPWGDRFGGHRACRDRLDGRAAGEQIGGGCLDLAGLVMPGGDRGNGQAEPVASHQDSDSYVGREGVGGVARRAA